MFDAAARIHDRPMIRLLLIAFGLAATGLLLWPAVFFVGLMFKDPFSAPIAQLAWTFLLGVGGIMSLLAAWVRVAVKNEVLQRSRRTFVFTLSGLAVGVALGVLILTGWVGAPLDDSLFWVFLTVTLVGCFLLAATIGARTLPPNNTVERDGPQAARPSL
jgi:MFS family permease